MTLKRKVFLQALMLLLVCDVLSSGISFVVSKQLISDQIIASKRNELTAIDDRIRDTYIVVREKQDLLADDYDLQARTAAVERQSSSYEKTAQIERVLNQLSVELYNMKELESLNVISGRWVMSVGMTDSVGFTAEGAELKPNLDSAALKREALPMLSRIHVGKALSAEHAVVSRITANSYLVGIIDFGELITDKRMNLQIRNKEGRSLYEQNAPDSAREEQARRSSYLEIRYSSPQSDMEYSLFLNERDIEEKFRKPLLIIIFISLCIFVAFGALLYMNTDRLLKPISSFSTLLTHIEHASQTDEIDRFVEEYRRKGRMRKRLYVYFSLGIVPLFIVIVANFVFFRDVVILEARTKDDGTVREIRSNIEYKMESYGILMKRLSLDSSIQNELLRLAKSEAAHEDSIGMSDLVLNKGILAQNIRYIRFYDERHRLLYTSDNAANAGESQAQWQRALSDRLTPYYWTVENEEDAELRHLVLYGKIKYLPRSGREIRAFRQIGYVEMAMKPFFDEKIGFSTEQSNRAMYVFDGDGNMLYTSKPHDHDSERKVRQWLEGGSLRRDGAEFFEEQAVDGMTIASGQIQGADWHIVYAMPSNDGLAGNDRILVNNLIVVAVMLLLAIALSEWLAKQILRPIEKLIRLMEGMDRQRLNHRALYLGNNEFAHMALSFKNMLARLHSMSEDIKAKELERFELEKRKKEAQLTALQSQMNPHFLYNIFTSIHLLVKTNQNAKASEMIMATGRLLRFGLYRGNQIISVAEELEHVGAYVRIQEIRYHARVRVDLQGEEGIESYRMPKFLLQPVVENAFEHASSQDKPLSLAVRLARIGDSRLIIRVEDDGVGIPEDRLASIRERLDHHTPSDHIGLLNVHERIRLFYGADYGLDIRSVGGEGTVVTLTLPLIKEDS